MINEKNAVDFKKTQKAIHNPLIFVIDIYIYLYPYFDLFTFMSNATSSLASFF